MVGSMNEAVRVKNRFNRPIKRSRSYAAGVPAVLRILTCTRGILSVNALEDHIGVFGTGLNTLSNEAHRDVRYSFRHVIV